MAKMLNLDEMKPEVEKSITLHGENHVMKAMSVGEFIDMQRNIAKMDKLRKDRPEDMEVNVEEFELLVQMIDTSFPTISEADIRNLTLEQLNAIFDFTQEVVNENGESTEGNATEAK